MVPKQEKGNLSSHITVYKFSIRDTSCIKNGYFYSMKKISAFAAFFFLALLVDAQIYFNRNISIPVSHGGALQLPWAGGLNYPLFSSIDFNNDGLKDLFVFDRSDNRVSTYLNNGA